MNYDTEINIDLITYIPNLKWFAYGGVGIL